MCTVVFVHMTLGDECCKQINLELGMKHNYENSDLEVHIFLYIETTLLFI